MKTPKTLTALIALIALAGCEQIPTTTPDVTETPDASVQPVAEAPIAPATLIPAAPTGPTAFALTYYKSTATRAPVNGWATKTYTSTGACVVYQANRYCWDDGVKTMAWVDAVTGTHYGPYTYSYFNFGSTPIVSTWAHTGANLLVDGMAAPLLITSHVDSMLGASLVDAVLTTGVPTQTTCTESDGKLNCNGFTIDLNQLHL